MTRCPKCGSYEGVTYSLRVNGWETRFAGWDGSNTAGTLEKVRYGPMPATVVCLSCKKRVPNPLPGDSQ
jgi:hypothetical protein